MNIIIADTIRAEDAFNGSYSGRTQKKEILDKDGNPTGETETIELHTKAEWVDVCVKKYIDEVVKGYEVNKSADDARKTANTAFTSVL